LAAPVISDSADPDAVQKADHFSGTSNSVDKELRRSLKAKDKEIDRLNAECLELEDQVSALKKEVESVWKTYKSSQVDRSLYLHQMICQLIAYFNERI
jgi:peptidoglycan hydrolase CwlO-like protein